MRISISLINRLISVDMKFIFIVLYIANKITIFAISQLRIKNHNDTQLQPLYIFLKSNCLYKFFTFPKSSVSKMPRSILIKYFTEAESHNQFCSFKFVIFQLSCLQDSSLNVGRMHSKLNDQN